MKTSKEIALIIQRNKKELREKYGLQKIGIFGSYARDEQDKKSDIDMLVEVKRPMGFVKFIKLEQYLSRLLNARVDLVTPKALKPYIGKRILKEVRYV